MRTRLIPVVLAALVLTACGGGDDEPSPSPSTGSPGASSPAPTSPAPADSPSVLTGFGPGPYSTTATGTQIAYLDAVRVAGQDGFDRVVWQFQGPVPACTVKSVSPPITNDPSDQVVTIPGTAFIQVLCQGASGVNTSVDPFQEIYTGPDRVAAGDTEVVTEAVLTGDFEAVLTWTVGLEKASGFRVSTLGSPSRVILDVQQ